MSNQINHPYHLVDESPWPLVRSFGGFFITSGIVAWFHTNRIILFFIAFTILRLVIFQWWRDVSREGCYQGLHSALVELGLRWGIALFIVSEVFFFLSFFWAFFHSRLTPTIEVGRLWPPAGIIPFNAFQVPLLNTLVLLSSGVRVTWRHHAIIERNYSQARIGLGLTIILGLYFTALQGIEYWEAPFTFADRIYGSTFYLATGFHGLHVIVGTLFLIVCFIRNNNCEFSPSHHFGFEAAAWYWHFVDVVWLFLYITIYWWGRK